MKKTIEDILMNFNDSEVDKVVCDYEGEIYKFNSILEAQDDLPLDDEATYKLKDRVLTIIVR